MNISKRTMILFFVGLAAIAAAYFSFKADRTEPEEVEELEPEEVEELEPEEVETLTPEKNVIIQEDTTEAGTGKE